MKRYLDSSCLNLMRLIKALPPSVDREKYDHYIDVMRKNGKLEAENALYYYGSLWNIR